MTTTAHEDQFAPEPACDKCEGTGIVNHPDNMEGDLAPGLQTCPTCCEPHNAVAGIYKNIRVHRGIE